MPVVVATGVVVVVCVVWLLLCIDCVSVRVFVRLLCVCYVVGVWYVCVDVWMCVGVCGRCVD